MRELIVFMTMRMMVLVAEAPSRSSPFGRLPDRRLPERVSSLSRTSPLLVRFAFLKLPSQRKDRFGVTPKPARETRALPLTLRVAFIISKEAPRA
jgi:hypothetical protein